MELERRPLQEPFFCGHDAQWRTARGRLEEYCRNCGSIRRRKVYGTYVSITGWHDWKPSNPEYEERKS